MRENSFHDLGIPKTAMFYDSSIFTYLPQFESIDYCRLLLTERKKYHYNLINEPWNFCFYSLDSRHCINDELIGRIVGIKRRYKNIIGDVKLKKLSFDSTITLITLKCRNDGSLFF